MAIAGVGTIFKRGDGTSSESFTAIAEINQIEGPTMVREQIETTSLDTTGGWRTFIAGFRDGGEITLTMNYVRDGYEQMRLDFLSDDSVNYQLVLPDPDATTLDFAGYVTNLPLSITADDKVTATVTIKISGEVDLTS